MIVQFENDDPDAIKVLAKHFPPFDQNFFKQLKRVGTGELRRDLFWAQSDGEKVLSDYPREIQDAMMAGPVEVAVLVNDGIQRELKLVREMAPTEVQRSAGRNFDYQVQALQSKLADKSDSDKKSFKGDEAGIIVYAKGRISWEQIYGEWMRVMKSKFDPSTLEQTLKQNQMLGGHPPRPAPRLSA